MPRPLNTVRQYVRAAIEARLLADLAAERSTATLTAATDPVLARLWDNDKDSAYEIADRTDSVLPSSER